jgi:NADH:ubiquinone oxidoreductase subunit E
MEMSEVMSAEVREIFRKYMVDSGMVSGYAQKMISKGYALEEVADNLDMPLEWVQEVAEQTLVTA